MFRTKTPLNKLNKIYMLGSKKKNTANYNLLIRIGPIKFN